jgi:transcriptional regulator with PAS, ATPase and Fis domain
LFLDEIGDLEPGLQAQLLGCLEERRIVRFGGRVPVPVDVRIIAASQAGLAQAVAGGRFREDLFYRLNALNLRVPPLRQRGDDIHMLAMFFLRRLASEFRRDVRGLTTEALTAMWKHPWPGNVRELIAAIRRAVVVGNSPLISVADLALGPAAQSGPSRLRLRPKARSTEERDALLVALDRHRHVVARVAEEFGVSRVTLYRMLYRNNIRVRGLPPPREESLAAKDGGPAEAAPADGAPAGRPDMIREGIIREA